MPNGLAVTADRLRLEQALGNLVANALSHGRGPIQLSAVEQNGAVELHVLDEGPGFPHEFLPHAFERFSSADEARTGAGAGLGLAIAEVIARRPRRLGAGGQPQRRRGRRLAHDREGLTLSGCRTRRACPSPTRRPR